MKFQLTWLNSVSVKPIQKNNELSSGYCDQLSREQNYVSCATYHHHYIAVVII